MERHNVWRQVHTLLLLTLVCWGTSGCEKEGCLTGTDPECVVPTPCLDLAYSCSGGSAMVKVIAAGDGVPVSLDALSSPGDLLLQNDQVAVVIDALDHPHFLAPTGGSILDLAPIGGADSIRSIQQATGVLPVETPHYTDLRTFEGDGFAAVQVMGHLEDRPDTIIATRYEVRACEPGVRIRTEVVNLEPDPISLFLSDGYFYGGKGILPFSVGPGLGWEHPSFGLSTLGDGITESPYLISAAHTEPASSYAMVACNEESVFGFHGEMVTVAGLEARVLMPSDYGIFERFIAVSDGPSVSPAVDLALELREMLFDEPWVELTGQLQAGGDGNGLDEGLRAAVTISEGTTDTPLEERIPWTHARPDVDGMIAARVPADRDYVLAVESYGVNVAEMDVSVGSSDTDFGVLDIPVTGSITLDAILDGAQDHVQVFVHPADDATEEAVAAKMFGHFDTCAPLLGAPHGESPACNRVLVDGPVTVELTPGSYDIFATAGPFASIDIVRGVQVTAGSEETLELELETLGVVPVGALSADLHVHGGTSRDSTIPDETRVMAFLAARIDVIAATDHEVTGDYSEMIGLLGVEDRVAVMNGTEATGDILFKFLEDAEYPQVIGHWNLWPLPYDPDHPNMGAAWEEMALPGEVFTRMRDAGWDEDTGVIQMNHPLSYLEFGRDLGWITAIGLDATGDLPLEFDGSLPSLFAYQPPGADFANSDYHVQEVMNGTDNDRVLQYRALWFYLLNQGFVRAATANSDSHTLTNAVLGTPRNLVWADTDVIGFDDVAFNEAVRDGRMIGTNGPVIEISTEDDGGVTRTPSVTPIDGVASDGTLQISIHAAPWVPVDEVRIIVNGQVVRTLVDELDHPDDPAGLDGLLRLDMELPLDELLPDSGDCWLVVEAGHALEPNADLSCDGFDDTGDNNGDGTIDWRDVEELEEDPEEDCLSTTGPLADPPPPDDRDDPDYVFRAVTPDGYPFAYTNPLIFDRDGDGFEGVDR
jgi:hypothetical protein